MMYLCSTRHFSNLLLVSRQSFLRQSLSFILPVGSVLFLLSLFFFSAPDVSASTLVIHDIATSTVWSKEDGPYIVSNPFKVLKNASLTVSPGTVIKISDNGQFIVEGRLSIGSLSGERTFVTSTRDDSVGGDSNNDLSNTAPDRGSWPFPLKFESGSKILIENASVKYGGSEFCPPYFACTYESMIINDGGDVSITGSSFSESKSGAFETKSGNVSVQNSVFTDSAKGIIQTGGSLSVSSSTFDHIDTEGIESTGGTVSIYGSGFSHGYGGALLSEAHSTFGGNVFTGLSDHGIIVAGGTFLNEGKNQRTNGVGGVFLSNSFLSDVSIGPDEVPYIIRGMSIPAGFSFTVRPGSVLKIQNGFNVAGVLNIGAEGSSSVIVTSVKDDGFGGDSNGDGNASVPSPGDWDFGVTFTDGSKGIIKNTAFKYGGDVFKPPYWAAQYNPVIQNSGGTVAVSKTSFTDSPSVAIEHLGGITSVESSSFERIYSALRAKTAGLTVHESNFNDVNIGLENGTDQDVDATFNWWGHSTGPKIGSNPTNSLGSWIFGLASVSPWQTEYFASAGVGAYTASSSEHGLLACIQDCFSNVLFLPGIEASRLYMEDNSGGETRLWEPNSDDDARMLLMDQSGSSVNDVYAKDGDVIDEAYSFGPNIYESFIVSMDNLKSSGAIRDWEAVAYDWRLSFFELLERGVKQGRQISYLVPTESPYIIQELKRLADSSQTGKVTIVAHSNGGLLAKALMIKLREIGETGLVDKLIFVGVPQTGTPKAIGSLLHGFGEGIPFLFSSKAARELALTMPSAYALLPTQAYFASVETPVASFNTSPKDLWMQSAADTYGLTVDSYSEQKGFLLGNEGRSAPLYADMLSPSVLKTEFLENAESVHQVLDAWTPPPHVELVQIAGWGLDTVSGIRYFDASVLGEMNRLYSPVITEDGDGTVVIPSALALAAGVSGIRSYWINLKEYNGFANRLFEGRVVNRKHADILEVGAVEDIIRNEIRNEETLPSKYVSTSPLVSTNEEEKLVFMLHSSQDALAIIDDEGNYTGISTTTGFVEENVPDTQYEEFGDVTYISIKKPSKKNNISATSTVSVSSKEKKIKAVVTKKENKTGQTEQESIEALPKKKAALEITETKGVEIASSTVVGIGEVSATSSVSVEVILQPVSLPSASSTEPIGENPSQMPDTPGRSEETPSSLHKGTSGGGRRKTAVSSNASIATTSTKVSEESFVYLDVSVEDFIKRFLSFSGSVIKKSTNEKTLAKTQTVVSVPVIVKTPTNSLLSNAASVEPAGGVIQKIVRKVLGWFSF